MQLAQKLYEGVELSNEKAVGLITYMRTDGLHVGTTELINILLPECLFYGILLLLLLLLYHYLKCDVEIYWVARVLTVNMLG